ncbi:Mitochondrial glycoprotein [Novymonas esmeraldas]|uniref:Mitochondrial glycoprotein n=1 Tax=Novymonas esmeraldas TaxID=1808958 RepID=A0AAW0EY17_9TRYP
MLRRVTSASAAAAVVAWRPCASPAQHRRSGSGGGGRAWRAVRAYATAAAPPPPLRSSDGAAESGDGHGGHSHPPTLRSALPPSAVELPEESFVKCIDKEIMDERLRLDKEDGPPPVPVGWQMHHTNGTSLIYGRRLWMPPPPASSSSASASAASSSAGQGDDAEQHQQQQQPVARAMERHLLRVQLTARDASLDPECDVRGEHCPFSFFVQRLAHDGAADACHDDDPVEEHTFYHDSIEVRCDVVEGELLVVAVVHHGPPSTSSSAAAVAAAAADVSAGAGDAPPPPQSLVPRYTNPFGGYPGPDLDEAEEEVLDGVQSWLAERGVDDQLGEFVGQYAVWIEQAEYEGWLQQLRDYVVA